MQHMNRMATETNAPTESPILRAKSNVFLVDDDASVRRALARLIKSAGHQVQTFASAQEFLERIDGVEEEAGCLVLDVRMPGLTGLDLQRKLQSKNRNLPIVFITGHGDIPMSVKAMKAGAVDFLPKPVKDNVLLRAIEQAITRASRDRAARQEVEDVQRRVGTLTSRELEVMPLVASGLPNKMIAFKLGTVEKTIKVHRARIMRKMQAQSLPDLVRAVEKLNLAQKDVKD
jgi:FixJ family two-component response regulator